MLSRHISKTRVKVRLKNIGHSTLIRNDKNVIYFFESSSRSSESNFLVESVELSRACIIILRHLNLVMNGAMEGDYLISTCKTSTKIVILNTSILLLELLVFGLYSSSIEVLSGLF